MAEFELNELVLSVPDAMLNKPLKTALTNGGYEFSEVRAVRSRVQEGNRVLDLGAGLGYVAAICARHTGAENVVAVEANPELLEVLRGNFDRNGFEQIQIIHGAVIGGLDGPDSIDFEKKKAFWAGRLANEDSLPENIVSVPVLSLQHLLDEVRPHVVVMDIEGAEEQMFDAPWPAYVQYLVLELHPGLYHQSVIKRIVDCMSASDMTYDPFASRGKVISFRRIREK